jgi:hypothetical protein
MGGIVASRNRKQAWLPVSDAGNFTWRSVEVKHVVEWQERKE